MLAIVGPTGSGKSALSLLLAHRFHGEVINCDSVQVYRGFDIGTAKLTAAERGDVVHHLIDVAGPRDTFTAGDYARLGRAALRQISARGRLPIVAGGTGFYLRALVSGLSPSPPRDEALRARLLERERARPGSLHRLLKRLDKDAGSRIHRNDLNKTLRALELRMLRGEPQVTQVERDGLTGYRLFRIGLNPPREQLYATLNKRLQEMFHGGLIEEVSGLLASGVPGDAKPFESLGYKEALAFLSGRMSLEAAIEGAQTATRQYAKRQLTWFRNQEQVHWITGFGADSVVQEEASRLVSAWLNCPLSESTVPESDT